MWPTNEYREKLKIPQSALPEQLLLPSSASFRLRAPASASRVAIRQTKPAAPYKDSFPFPVRPSLPCASELPFPQAFPLVRLPLRGGVNP